MLLNSNDNKKLTTIKEESGVPSAREMIQQLVDGQEEILRTARKAMPIVEDANDAPTAD